MTSGNATSPSPTGRRAPLRRSRADAESPAGSRRWLSRRGQIISVVIVLIISCVHVWFSDADPAVPEDYAFDIESKPVPKASERLSPSGAVAVIKEDSESRLLARVQQLGRELTYGERSEVLQEYFRSDLFQDESRFALLELKRIRPRRPRTEYSGPAFPGKEYLYLLTLFCEYERGKELWGDFLWQALESLCSRGHGVFPDDPFDVLWEWMARSIRHWSESELQTALDVWPEYPFLAVAHEIAAHHRLAFDARLRDLDFGGAPGLRAEQIRSAACQYNFKPNRTRNRFLRSLDRRVRRVERGGTTAINVSETPDPVSWGSVLVPNGLGRAFRRHYEESSLVEWHWFSLGCAIENWLLVRNAICVRLHLLRNPDWSGDLSQVTGFRVAQGAEAQRFDRTRGALWSPEMTVDVFPAEPLPSLLFLQPMFWNEVQVLR